MEKTSNHADATFVLVGAKHVFLHLHLWLHYDAVVANMINLNLDIACSPTTLLLQV